MEEEFGSSAAELDLAELVDQDQVDAAVAGDGAGEVAFVDGFGELVDELGGEDVADTVAVFGGGAEGDETVLEVGWVVRDELTGRGYASEIGQTALGWAATFFPEFPVATFTEVHNLASVAVMRRLGLHGSGVIYREGLVAGQTGLHARAPFALYRQIAVDR